MRGNDRKQAIGDTIGLEVHDTEERFGMRLGQRAQQPWKVVLVGQVIAPTARVLCYQHDLAHACFHLRPHIACDILERKAPIRSPDGRDGAIRTLPIAPIGYLHIGEGG